MKTLGAIFTCIVLCFGISAMGQTSSDPASSIKAPGWNLGVFAIGGRGLSDDSDIHNFGLGGRIGRVFMHEGGPAFLRGTLEWNAEILPFHQYYGRGETATGAIVNPLVVKWNFTGGDRVTPFFELLGGTVFTSKDFPPGDTSTVNFNTGAGAGLHIFSRSKRSIDFDVRALHISNASIGNHNPGVNASLQFTLGYTWWKR